MIHLVALGSSLLNLLKILENPSFPQAPSTAQRPSDVTYKLLLIIRLFSPINQLSPLLPNHTADSPGVYIFVAL